MIYDILKYMNLYAGMSLRKINGAFSFKKDISQSWRNLFICLSYVQKKVTAKKIW